MIRLAGAPVATGLTEKATEKIAALRQKGITPCLAVLRVGNREDDLSYERGILKRFEKVNLPVRVVTLPEDVGQSELEAALMRLNRDASVHGILVFRPLPGQLDEKRIATLIAPEKDVDGMHPMNSAKIYLGDASGFAPCTAAAVMNLLAHYEFDLTGKRVTVVGRSAVIGKPLALLMLAKHATVTVCHTKTKELADRCREADLVIASAGVVKMINGDFLKAGQWVVDVGIHMTEEGLCGDVDSAAAEGCEAVTPVPGGVGAVTTSVLLMHTVQAAEAMQSIRKENGTESFLSALASSEPIPGGGGASALIGNVGAALCAMVAHLTDGKKKYAEYWEDITEILKKTEDLMGRLHRLQAADEEAFLPLAKAYGIPKEDPTREDQMETALKEATAVPLELMETLAELTPILQELQKKGSRLAVSDVAVAAAAVAAAMEGAAMNVWINLRTMKDETFAQDAKQKAETLLQTQPAACRAVYAEITSALKA